LCPEARALWDDLQREFVIDDEAGRLLLLSACESLHQLRAAEKVIEKDGMTQTGRDGTVRRHPAVSIGRDARNGMLQALRLLRLEPEPSPPRRLGRGPSAGGGVRT